MNVIVSNKEWNRQLAAELTRATGAETVYICDKKLVTFEYLSKLQPQFIFFPHWSDMIPAEVYENFECIVFHMTDLPFGRGGSPLQNLIVQGVKETKLSAIRCVRELDAGDIYLKKDLSLYGTAEEIFLRARELIADMMKEIIKKKIIPQPQAGKPVIFRRRHPEEGNVGGLTKLETVFDYIRMLDADGYPKAFADIGRLHFEFERASLRDEEIIADVKITMRDE